MEAEYVHRNGKVVIVSKLLIKTVQKDVDFDICFSNLVMYFIMLTCGTVLFSDGLHQIDTVEQGAAALKPVADRFANLLFLVKVVGTGFLAIPILSGSVSYIFAETFNWTEGLDKKCYQAKPFYSVCLINCSNCKSKKLLAIDSIDSGAFEISVSDCKDGDRQILLKWAFDGRPFL